jgi:ABC-2 type transport system ATP-binding protein
VIVSTDGLVKRYGATVALDHVDLAVPEGSVYGLVGPNGAGKTTLLGILSGLRRPTAGTATIAVKRSAVSVLPDTPQFEPWLTAREIVDLSRTLGNPDVDRGHIDEVLDIAGLTGHADRRVGGFSRGMLQRLGVAATVVTKPRLLILDEPSSALDPMGRREVLDLVTMLRGDATVLFSSHILGDVQEVCDTVGVLRSGAILYQGPITDLLVGSATPAYRVVLLPPVDAVARTLSGEEWVTRVDRHGEAELLVAVASTDDAAHRLVRALAAADARVVSFAPEAPTLEDVFLELTT